MYCKEKIKNKDTGKNGCHKYDDRVMYKKYPLTLLMGCGVAERHLEMAQPTKKDTGNGLFLKY